MTGAFPKRLGADVKVEAQLVAEKCFHQQQQQQWLDDSQVYIEHLLWENSCDWWWLIRKRWYDQLNCSWGLWLPVPACTRCNASLPSSRYMKHSCESHIGFCPVCVFIWLISSNVCYVLKYFTWSDASISFLWPATHLMCVKKGTDSGLTVSFAPSPLFVEATHTLLMAYQWYQLLIAENVVKPHPTGAMLSKTTPSLLLFRFCFSFFLYE